MGEAQGARVELFDGVLAQALLDGAEAELPFLHVRHVLDAHGAGILAVAAASAARHGGRRGGEGATPLTRSG